MLPWKVAASGSLKPLDIEVCKSVRLKLLIIKCSLVRSSASWIEIQISSFIMKIVPTLHKLSFYDHLREVIEHMTTFSNIIGLIHFGIGVKFSLPRIFYSGAPCSSVSNWYFPEPKTHVEPDLKLRRTLVEFKGTVYGVLLLYQRQYARIWRFIINEWTVFDPTWYFLKSCFRRLV